MAGYVIFFPYVHVCFITLCGCLVTGVSAVACITSLQGGEGVREARTKVTPRRRQHRVIPRRDTSQE